MATKMIDMGMKRKETMTSVTAPASSSKDYDNEKVYPELTLSGPQAEMMGAEDLKEGDLVEQTMQWRVKRHSKTEEGGKTDYSMTLCLEKASDCKECDGDTEDAGDAADASEEADSEPSPAMAYIQGKAKEA